MRKDTNAPTNLTKNNRFEVLNEPSNSQRNNERHNSNNSNSKSKNRNNFQNKNTKTTKTNVVLPFTVFEVIEISGTLSSDLYFSELLTKLRKILSK